MKQIILRSLVGMAMLGDCTIVMAATMDISAEFSPSMEHPENNEFTNTTPLAGYCDHWAYLCAPGQFSISLANLSLSGNGVLSSSDKTPENNFFLSIPNETTVDILNVETGNKTAVTFKITHFSGQWTHLTGGAQNGWDEGTFSYPSSNSTCSSGATGIGSGDGDGNTWYGWAWSVKGNRCFKINNQASRDITNSLLSDVSFGYKLITPNPLLLESGKYSGQINWAIGRGGNIDFGNMWLASDSQLTINFSLTVNHELKLTIPPESQAVSLYPCAPGSVCSEEEGQANWERWIVTRITPQLTGRSNFNLSSSGSFTVFLECEQQNGPDCALISDKMPSQKIPVQTLLTLPDNIVDVVTGTTVFKRRLEVGKDLTKNIFITKIFGQNRAGSVDFLVSQKDTDTMLATRPDTYRGAVTVIFDPQIF